ncbi:MAG TPA: hypothetical protein VI729_01340 [Anaerolineales bacterium]|nr:hypothetical protein [Anaerolineales bacterium]
MTDSFCAVIILLMLFALFAALTHYWDRRTRVIKANLSEIMARAVAHKTVGEQRTFADATEWIRQAIAIVDEAISCSKEYSSMGPPVAVPIDRTPPSDPTIAIDKYVSILGALIKKIRAFIERDLSVDVSIEM